MRSPRPASIPARLELEITESVFLNDDEGTDAMFAALKRIGVRLALDDFGTGYSSLGYLKKAPFDKIKIDQSFVRGATEPGSRNGAIIASITSLAHALGMDTTAEGVETLDELDLVRMHGCSHVQGFIYERPLDAAAATERLKTGLAAVAKGPALLARAAPDDAAQGHARPSRADLQRHDPQHLSHRRAGRGPVERADRHDIRDPALGRTMRSPRPPGGARTDRDGRCEFAHAAGGAIRAARSRQWRKTLARAVRPPLKRPGKPYRNHACLADC